MHALVNEVTSTKKLLSLLLNYNIKLKPHLETACDKLLAIQELNGHTLKKGMEQGETETS